MGHNGTKRSPPYKKKHGLSLLRKQLSYHLQEKHVAKMASNVDDAAGFGSGACSGTHLDPLLQRDKFKNCKGQQRFDILQPVILAGSLSGGRILSTSSVQIGFEYMSGHFTEPNNLFY